MSQLVWQTLEKAKASGFVFTKFSIPVFSSTGFTWLGASMIGMEFTLPTSLTNFSFRFPVTPPSGANFCLAIRWIDVTVKRRKLWDNVGESLDYPLYNGETIKTSPVLEIWTIQTSTTISLAAILAIVSGIFSAPQLCCENPELTFNTTASVQDATLFATLTTPPDNFPYNFVLTKV
jgi:hypothetical protein